MSKKILIIDDEDQLLQALVKKLTKEGFEVFTASDGKEGLLETAKNSPDLILLDLILPVMDGMTFLEKLRDTEKFKDTPVLVLTNLDDSRKVEESQRHGATDYLVKTAWTLDDIVSKVNKILAK